LTETFAYTCALRVLFMLRYVMTCL